MFDGRFKEGEGLRSEDLKEIPLVDDDLEATELLVRIIHHQSWSISRVLSTTELRDLGVVVDKYACHECTDFAVSVWLARLKPDALSHAEMVALMDACYLLDRPEDFKRYTQSFVMDISLENDEWVDALVVPTWAICKSFCGLAVPFG